MEKQEPMKKGNKIYIKIINGKISESFLCDKKYFGDNFFEWYTSKETIFVLDIDELEFRKGDDN